MYSVVEELLFPCGKKTPEERRVPSGVTRSLTKAKQYQNVTSREREGATAMVQLTREAMVT